MATRQQTKPNTNNHDAWGEAASLAASLIAFCSRLLWRWRAIATPAAILLAVAATSWAPGGFVGTFAVSGLIGVAVYVGTRLRWPEATSRLLARETNWRRAQHVKHRWRRACADAGIDHRGAHPKPKKASWESGSVRLKLVLPAGFAFEQLEAKAAAILSAFNAHEVRVQRDGSGRHAVVLIRLDALPDTVQWTGQGDADRLWLGEGMRGDVYLCLDHAPHTLVGGSPSSGKTTLLRLLAVQAVRHHDTRLCTSKLFGLDDMPVPVAYGLAASAALMANVRRDLEIREELIRARGAAGWTPDLGPRLVVLMDEAVELLSAEPGGKTGPAAAENALHEQLAYDTGVVLQRGRQAGLNLILAGQRWDLFPGFSGANRFNAQGRIATGPQLTAAEFLFGDRHACDAVTHHPGRAMVAFCAPGEAGDLQMVQLGHVAHA